MKAISKVMAVAAASAAMFAAVSCASTNVACVEKSFDEQNISVSSLNREDYVILGRVYGEGSVVAKDKDIALGALVSAKKDTLRYGWTNSKHGMTVEEKAVANAMYEMIKNAEANGADTVAFVNTRVAVVPNVNESGTRGFIRTSTVNAKVSGIAIKINAEAGDLVKASYEEPEDLDPVGTAKINKANAKREQIEEARRIAIEEAKAREEAKKAAAAEKEARRLAEEAAKEEEESEEKTMDDVFGESPVSETSEAEAESTEVEAE